jgi:hypothetical protein
MQVSADTKVQTICDFRFETQSGKQAPPLPPAAAPAVVNVQGSTQAWDPLLSLPNPCRHPAPQSLNPGWGGAWVPTCIGNADWCWQASIAALRGVCVEQISGHDYWLFRVSYPPLADLARSNSCCA